MKTLFFPRKDRKDNDGNCPLFLRLKHDGEKVNLSLDSIMKHSLIPIDKWDYEHQQVSGKTVEAKEINAEILELKVKVADKIKKLSDEETPVSLIEYLKAYLQGKIIDVPHTVLSAFDSHLILIDSKISFNTLRKYKSIRTHITNFISEKYKVADMLVKNVDLKFGEDFFKYMLTKGENNHAIKVLQTFTVFVLDYSFEHAWIKNPEVFRHLSMKLEAVEIIPLNEDQLNKLIEFKFERDNLNYVKDIFIFCCFTGLAYSDVAKLSSSDIEHDISGEKFIVMKRTKTDNKFRVKLLPVAIQILDKYKNHPICTNSGKLLPVYSNQKMNQYLKTIGDNVFTDCNLELTTHIARHTFATTVTLENGVPMDTVSKMLGHKSIKTTQIYAQVTKKKISRDMEAVSSKYMAIAL